MWLHFIYEAYVCILTKANKIRKEVNFTGAYRTYYGKIIKKTIQLKGKTILNPHVN